MKTAWSRALALLWVIRYFKPKKRIFQCKEKKGVEENGERRKKRDDTKGIFLSKIKFKKKSAPQIKKSCAIEV